MALCRQLQAVQETVRRQSNQPLLLYTDKWEQGCTKANGKSMDAALATKISLGKIQVIGSGALEGPAYGGAGASAISG